LSTLISSKENVILTQGSLVLEVLPALGGKLASLRYGGNELLQQPLVPYAPRTRDMGFEESDASGFDECLPSVAACTVETSAGTVSVPDHGDFWRIPWNCEQTGPNELFLEAQGFSLPILFRKRIRLEEDAVHLLYEVKNTGATPLSYLWSAHPLFAVNPGDRIVLPPSVTEVSVEGSGKGRLSGKSCSWPIAVTSDGSTVDLSFTGSATDGIGDKLFASTPNDGWCVLERPQVDLRLEVQFEPKVTPYLGLWLCYGGWPEDHVARQYCVALEPCMAPADSLALGTHWAHSLAPGQTESWPLTIRLSSLGSKTKRQ
jgi:galactose mutarotase-like enzyme